MFTTAGLSDITATLWIPYQRYLFRVSPVQRHSVLDTSQKKTREMSFTVMVKNYNIKKKFLTVLSPRFRTRQCRNAVPPSCTVILVTVLLSMTGSIYFWKSSILEYHIWCHWGECSLEDWISRLPAKNPTKQYWIKTRLLSIQNITMYMWQIFQ